MASPPESFNRLASARQRTLELTAEMTQEDSERRPAHGKMRLGEAGAWSTGEILDHLLRVFRSLAGEIETLYEREAKGECTVLKRTFRDYDVAPVPIPKSLMPFFEPGFHLLSVVSKAVLPLPVRERILRNRTLPVKNPAKWAPVAGRKIGELRSELESSLEKLEQVLQRDTKKPLEEMILSHTVFGSYSVPELLGILEVHETWHRQDLERLQQAA